MRQTGLYPSDDIRLANEGKILARWKLGRALAQVEREKPRPGKTTSAGLTQLLDRIGLDKQTAMEARRDRLGGPALASPQRITMAICRLDLTGQGMRA